MSNLQKLFYQERKNHNQTKNDKQNNLSFRNIAANLNKQSFNEVQNSNLKYTQNSQIKTDKNFKSICNDDSRVSFYTNGEEIQQELNYVVTCFNHPNKSAEYQQSITQRQYCKLCAAKLASQGYKLQLSQNLVQRDISPLINRFRSKDQSRIIKNQIEVFQQKNNKNSSSFLAPPVKFSSIISQKNRFNSLENKFEETQKIIDDYMDIYSEKIQKIEELINDIRIKDTQYVNKLRAQNKAMLQKAERNQQFEVKKSNYDLFGKSIFKQSSSSQGEKFKLPSEDRVQRLVKIIQFIEEFTLCRDESPINLKRIPLIKSVNSTQSNGNNLPKNDNSKEFLLKNSSSVSNLSTKSNFKKEKKISENSDKFGSQINQNKVFKNDQLQIESSRFSSNSAVIRKKNINSGKTNIQTESVQFVRKNNTKKSSQDSDSCQDTPESIKSKISANSFVLPKNTAVTMFQKINVCQSIDVMPQVSLKDAQITQDSQEDNLKKQEELTLIEMNSNLSYKRESIKNEGKCMKQSGYDNKSANRSVQSRGRKSFNRYQNVNNQQ